MLRVQADKELQYVAYVFLSYSHEDEAYALKLEKAMKDHGLLVWRDSRIDYGSEWPDVIEKHLDQSTAVALVMSENSKKSRWVKNELTRAHRKNIPVFPLLLSGEAWLALETTQYADVAGGALPPDDFYTRLAEPASPSFQHVEILRQGVVAWNQWRRDNPLTRPTLRGADLCQVRLFEYTSLLSGGPPTGAVTGADLTGADLTRANLWLARLSGADLTGADLTRADLTHARLSGADLTRADLTHARLSGADLTGADLTEAILTGAVLRSVRWGPSNPPTWPTGFAPPENAFVGRNEPCPCGSGKKYKRCHGHVYQ